jgi:outer membrane lipoprotein LolB
VSACSRVARVRVVRVTPCRVAAILISAALAGCVTTPATTSAPPPWPERRAALQADDAFTLVGRVAISTPGSGVNASINWRQDGQRSRITLDGPFGAGGAEIELDGERIDLRTSKGVHLEGEAASEELTRQLGFPLPLPALRYWVRGVPAPNLAATEDVDANAQRLTRLMQDGWEIDYTAYLDDRSEALPKRLAAAREGTRVKLIVDRWEP